MTDTGLIGEAFRLILRWTHLVAAVVWIGGALFYLLVLRPALAGVPAAERGALQRRIDGFFREIVQSGIIVLLISGAVLTFDRLSAGVGGGLYAGVLGLKVALSLAMFWFAWRIGRRGAAAAGAVLAEQTPNGRPARSRTGPIILALGLIVLLLALILRAIFEAGLRAPMT